MTTYKIHRQALLHSYSQIFFARSEWYGLVLVLASLIHPVIGISGLLATILANILAQALSLSRTHIQEGLYGFGAALVGMGMGAMFNWTSFFFVMLVIMALFCILITLMVQGLLAKYHLPYLSLPFLLVLWVLKLSAVHFKALHPATGMLSFPEYFYKLSMHGIDNMPLPELVLYFLRSLGSVFFQNNALVGLIIAIGLFCYSRISFFIAFVGFSWAWLFYLVAGLDTKDMSEHLVGSNYIFTSIAVGAYFLVPNKFSFLAALVLVPITAIIHYAFSSVLGVLGLTPYSLSFL